MNFDQACDVILWLQNSMDKVVSWNKRFIIYRTTAAKNYVVCRNTAQVVRLKMHVDLIATFKCIKGTT